MKSIQYEVAKKNDRQNERIYDEMTMILPVLRIVEEALKECTTDTEEGLREFSYGAGWIIEKVSDHLGLAMKHYEEALAE